MSFREKIAWVSLLSTIVIWAPYFGHALGRSGSGDLMVGWVLPAFVGAVVLQTLIGIVATAAITVRSGREPRDERDAAVEAKALKIAYFVLITLGFVVVSFAVFRTVAPAPRLTADGSAILLMSQLVLFCFVVAEITRFLTQVICYRRGA